MAKEMYPKGHWLKWESLESVMQPFIKANYWPSKKEVDAAAGVLSAYAVIGKHFGGKKAVAERFGISLDNRKCSDCGIVKSRPEFQLVNSNKDQRYKRCRECTESNRLAGREAARADFKTLVNYVERKECSACKTVKPIEEFTIYGHGSGRCHAGHRCLDCDDKRRAKASYETPKGLARHICNRLRKRAKEIKVDFDLDAKWILERLNAQDWRCELTGVPFSIRPSRDGLSLIKERREGSDWGHDVSRTVSADRIIPGGNYTKNNVRLVTQRINTAMMHYGTDEFEELAIVFLKKRGWECRRRSV